MKTKPPLSSPLWTPLLILGIIPSCGVETVPPPETVRLEIECPSCKDSGIDTLLLHDETGVRKLALSSGGASAEVKGASVEEHEVWFASRSGPMLVEIVSRRDEEPIQAEESLHLMPVEWGDSALADTAVAIPLRDPNPRTLVWEGVACLRDASASSRAGQSEGACGDYQYEWKAADSSVPSPGGVALLHMPRLVAREGAFLAVEYAFKYRGCTLGATSLRSLPDIAWPPPLESSVSHLGVNGITLGAPTASGRRETLQLRPLAGRWVFHRVVFDARNRLWEDSGSWDSASGMARFARRGPGLSPRLDSTKLRPLQLRDLGWEVWWWEGDSPLEEVAVLEYPATSWVFFPEPR